VGATVQTYESERSAGVLRGPDDSLTVRVYGQDYGVLHREATKLAGRLAAVEGIRDPRVERPPQQPTVRVRVDLGAALRHGVKPGDVRRAAATLLSGITVGDFFERQKVFEVVVRGVASTHGSLTSVRDLVLDRPGDTGSGPGGHVRLGDVADVRIVAAPVDIRHDAVSRYVDVRAQVSGRDMGAVRGDVQRELRRSHLPLEYHAELPAAASGDRTTGGAFAILALGAALGVFLLLQAAFGSWRLALLFFLVLPAALCGGVAAAVASGHEHSLGAVGGLLAVFALAVRQGIVLIRHLQELERGEGALAPSRVLDAMRRRVTPVVASAVTVALAFLPAVALGDVAGNEITHPLAITILGGLATTLAAMLFLVPAAYLGAAGPVTAVSILERPEWLQRSLRRRPRSGDAAG
jgi:Cu/Ag efflux pump CusA